MARMSFLVFAKKAQFRILSIYFHIDKTIYKNYYTFKKVYKNSDQLSRNLPHYFSFEDNSLNT